SQKSGDYTRFDQAAEEPSMQEYLTPKDLAYHLGVHPSTVYNWLHLDIFDFERVQVSKNPQASRETFRYRLSVDTFNYLDRMVREHSTEMRRFVPRIIKRK